MKDLRIFNKDKIANYLIIIMVLIVLIAYIRHWYFNKQLNGKTMETVAIVSDINSGRGVRQTAAGESFIGTWDAINLTWNSFSLVQSSSEMLEEGKNNAIQGN